jgi:hypothetical protein
VPLVRDGDLKRHPGGLGQHNSVARIERYPPCSDTLKQFKRRLTGDRITAWDAFNHRFRCSDLLHQSRNQFHGRAAGISECLISWLGLKRSPPVEKDIQRGSSRGTRPMLDDIQEAACGSNGSWVERASVVIAYRVAQSCARIGLLQRRLGQRLYSRFHARGTVVLRARNSCPVRCCHLVCFHASIFRTPRSAAKLGDILRDAFHFGPGTARLRTDIIGELILAVCFLASLARLNLRPLPASPAECLGECICPLPRKIILCTARWIR